MDGVDLWIPGPTDYSDDVKKAMMRPMIDHRSEEFGNILCEVTDNLKSLLHTQSDVFTITGSGTTGLEFLIVNFLSPDEKVIAPSVGHFGNLFADIAEKCGIRVVRLEREWGTALDPDDLEKALKENPDAKAVLLTHNETSTGVTNDIKSLAHVAKKYGMLVLVDAVSSLGAIPCDIDGWNLDGTATASQKGFCVAPGLAFVTVSEAAWDAYHKNEVKSFTYDLGRLKQLLEKRQTPATPPELVYFGLQITLPKLLAETPPVTFERYHRVAEYFRSRLPEIGAHLFAKSNFSDTVSAISFADGIDCKFVREKLLNEEHIRVAGGMGPRAGEYLRVGKLGYRTEEDINRLMAALARVVKSLS